MYIKYRGSTKDNNFNRYAVIGYNPKEEESALRFMKIADLDNRFAYGEDDELIFKVDDKDDYDYFKQGFHNYKKIKWKKLCGLDDDVITKYINGYLTLLGIYDICETDLSLYAFIAEFITDNETEIMSYMREVSGADDAYNNALDLLYNEVF